MTIVRTRTPSGEAIVILPEAEFERLRELAEDAVDARAIDVSQSRLDAGEEELLTEADLDALRAAPSALAFWRQRRGMTVPGLASDSAVEESIVAAIDRGERTGDTSLYQRLARALDVDVEDISPEPEAA